MSESKNTPAISKRENIQVFVRVRPMNEKERLEKKNQNVVDLRRDRDVVVRDRTNAALTKTFTFDRAFGPASKQIDVYKAVAQPMIAEVLAGYNCTIFAYGQTGTGKTFTMEGDRSPGDGNSWDKDPLCGLVPRVLSHMFDELRLKNMEFTMAVTYLELYNEELIDLLSPEEDNSKMRLFEDAANKGSVIVQGLTDVRVMDKKQVYDILNQGSKKRQTAATYMNATSSRSHTIFTVTVHIRESTEAGEDLIRTGKINLVDLAGSENISRSGATNQRAKEAGNINQSLLTLGRVITGLVEKTPHIPYRESKLTRLLQDSLGGKTKTCIVATVSPVLANLEESMSTLDYAHRAKSITNRPQINQRLSKQAFIKEYDQEIERLRKDLVAQRSGHGIYVDPDNYNEMTVKLDRQDMEILEKIQQIRTLEDEKERRETFINALSEKLEQKTRVLEETTLNLQVTERDRDDKVVLLQHHEATEKILKQETEKLIGVTGAVVFDLDKVQDALSRKRVLEDVNKTTAKEFSSSVVNILQRANKESKNMQEKQSELMEFTRKQLEATQKLQSQALDTMLMQVQDFSALASSEAKEVLDITQKQQSMMIIMEKEHFEAFKTSLAAQKKQLLLSVEAQKAQLLLQKQLKQQLESTVAENSLLIGELVDQKFEELTLMVQKQKEIIFELNNQLQEKNDELIKQVNGGRMKAFDQEAKHKQGVIDNNQLMDTMQQLLQTVDMKFQEIRKHIQEESTSTADFLRSTTSDWEESSGLAISSSSLINTSNGATNLNCQELAAQLLINRNEICTLPQQQIVEVKHILREVEKVDDEILVCIHDSVQAMDQKFVASENSYKIKLDDRTKAVEKHAVSQKLVLDAMAVHLEEFKQQATTENAMKKMEGDTQVAQTQQALTNVEQTAVQLRDVVDSQMQNLQSHVDHFVDVELKEYLPSGETPARTSREYPRELKFTSPAAHILARHYAEVERIQDGTDSGMNSPENSSRSSASDLENHVEEAPVISLVVKERQPQAQRRILGTKNE